MKWQLACMSMFLRKILRAIFAVPRSMPKDAIANRVCQAATTYVLVHNTVRDIVEDYCKRGCLRPEPEAPALLRNISAPNGRRRPADVFVCSATCLARRLPDGSRLAGRRVALDFAIINAVGRGHWNATLQEPGSAEIAYAERKCRYQDTRNKCQQVGLEFQPMIMSSQGGMTPAMGGILHGIANAVATMEGALPEVVRKDMFERLAIAITRSNARAIVRRRIGGIGVRFRVASIFHLEEPPKS